MKSDDMTKDGLDRRIFVKRASAVAAGAFIASYAGAKERELHAHTSQATGTWPAWRRALIGKARSFHELDTRAGQLPTNYGPEFWNGVGITDHGDLFACANGGHGSDSGVPGAGNGTYSYHMWADDLSVTGWQMRHAGTPVENLESGGAVSWERGDGSMSRVAIYNAGRVRIHYPSADPISDPPSPCNQHSYYNQQYVAAAHAFDGQERMMRMCCEAIRQASGSSRTRQVDGFRIATNKWDFQGDDFAPSPGDPAAIWHDRSGGRSGNASSVSTWARDYRTGYIYGAMPGTVDTLQRFRPDVPGGQWDQLWSGRNSSNASHAGTLVDTARARWVWVRHSASSLTEPKIFYVELTGGTRHAIDIPYPDFDRHINNYAGHAYARDIDRYFILIGTQLGTGIDHDELWSFDPESGAPQLEATLPDRTPRGPCSGFGYIHELGGILLVREPKSPYNQRMRFFPTREAP